MVDAATDRRAIWARALKALGGTVEEAADSRAAFRALDRGGWDAIVLSAELPDRTCLAVGDYARFRLPDAKVIVVTDGRLFSDGRIFELLPNACACVSGATRPSDIAALVEFHVGAAETGTGEQTPFH